MSNNTAAPRWTPYAGLCFVVLMLANVFGSPSAGELGDRGDQVLARVAGHATAIQAWNWLLSIAVVALLAFAAGLTHHLAARGGAVEVWPRLAFAGSVVLACLALVQHAVTASLVFAQAGGSLSPGAAGLANQANYVTEDLVRVGLAVFVGAASMAMLRAGGARATAVLGLGSAALNLVAAGAVAQTGPMSPQGPLPALGLLSFVVWTIATAVRLLRRPEGAGLRVEAPADDARGAQYA